MALAVCPHSSSIGSVVPVLKHLEQAAMEMPYLDYRFGFLGDWDLREIASSVFTANEESYLDVGPDLPGKRNQARPAP
ncbi:hypothetical protein KAX17_06115 [Candidatus Bipolaricaulota bacterium]|nr:hypothetical protein [Candidatus Bipolaricaulota bacterium]